MDKDLVLVENDDESCILCGSNETRRVAMNTLAEIRIVLCSECIHDCIDAMKIDTFG